MTRQSPSKTFHAIVLGLSLLAGGLIALPSASAESSARLDRMAEVLDLSPDQRAEIEALFAAHQARMAELGLDPETRREGRAERYALMQEVQALLTTEQQQRWKAIRDQRRGRGQGSRRRLMQTLEGMALSDDQRASIRALIAEGRERGREERSAFLSSLETILTPEQFSEIQALVDQGQGPGARRRG